MGNISVSRGDNFEMKISKLLQSLGWHSRRMGGTIVNFPDVVATNNTDHTILSIEAKATSADRYWVPIEQIIRCFRLLEMFSVYKHQYVILAFKFMTKRAMVEVERARFEIDEIEDGDCIPKKQLMRRRYYEKRDIRYYYFNGNELKHFLLERHIIYSQLECDYFGRLRLTSAYRKTPLTLPQIKLDKHGIILPHQWQQTKMIN